MDYIMDFNHVKTEWDLHQAIKTGLKLPAYYGMNMDALWDCLTSNIVDPCVIYLKGVHSIPPALGKKVQTMLHKDNCKCAYAKKEPTIFVGSAY